MKIVQSFWSKPALKSQDYNISDRGKGGWPHRKYFYMSWALSCLQLKEYYNNVELITDASGYDILINKLQLPYSSTMVVLDDLNDYHVDLWALGKIYAYSLQVEPFIHADCDVFIWKKFPDRLEKARLLAQNFESGFPHYESIYEQLTSNFLNIPKVILDSQARNGKIFAVNAGILGGNDINFIKAYALTSIAFVKQNYDRLSHINIGLFNIIFEQLLFHAMAESQNIEVEYFLQNVHPSYEGIAQFIDAPRKTSFIHALSTYKKAPMVCDSLEFTLHTMYPTYYYKIINLLHTLQI